MREFIAQTPQTITSSRALAERMAGKAALIKDILANALIEDKSGSSELMDQYNAFKEHLIHDISIKDFADIYAETITYGMFGARLHDNSLETFSRQEALDLLPKSNPLLRNLFTYIAGPNLDQRIVWIIDDLARVFQASNVWALMEKYGRTTQRNDPFLHFYEDFLKAYNPEKRDARGVWYTPEPVVNFIIRAVDDVLKTDFGLADGLGDTSKVIIPWDTGQKDKKGKPILTTKEVHRVQILDPATGTGTFLAEVIKQIAPRVKNKAPGMWARYVEKDLIPRLHGFELLMASYAMCHLKLDMVLREYGYQPTAGPPRVSVYLTNSLEEGEAANQTLPFAQWLSNEVKEANKVKRDMPIMCVIGNPPYNNSSANMGEYARRIVEPYKENLEETRIHLDDDYVKFIRLAEILIERNGVGVVGYISNNSFLDGVTHREMRRHLTKTFSRIDIVNLHGDIRGGAGIQTGEADKNVFDITQGVTILICSKLSERDQGCTIRYTELIGDRDFKYDWLHATSPAEVSWASVEPKAPYYFFIPKSLSTDTYEEGLKLSELFGTYSSGIQTKRDAVCVAFDFNVMRETVHDFFRGDPERIRRAYSLPEDGRDWSVKWAIDDVKAGAGEVVPFLYRPFDIRFTYYSGRTKGFQAYPRRAVMKHIVGKQNFVLLANRQHVKEDFSYVGVTNLSNCHGTFYLGNRGQDYAFPLFLYPDSSELDQTRRANFEPKLYAQLVKLASHATRGEPDEIAVFDYIYGVLHCPAYRETYAEILKIDFPRIPWPASPDVFWDVSDRGGELRRLHLMEPAAIGETPYPFVGEGDGKVGKSEFRGGHVWINKDQRFENAPEISWSFYVGGYQPAQKWLKDRKGRALDWPDVQHYQRILKILAETDRIMATIEMPLD